MFFVVLSARNYLFWRFLALKLARYKTASGRAHLVCWIVAFLLVFTRFYIKTLFVCRFAPWRNRSFLCLLGYCSWNTCYSLFLLYSVVESVTSCMCTRLLFLLFLKQKGVQLLIFWIRYCLFFHSRSLFSWVFHKILMHRFK